MHRQRRFEANRIVELLGQFGRDESFLSKPVADLSGGEIQMVALLRAPEQQTELGQAARTFVEQQYDWRVIVPLVEAAYAKRT